MPHAQALNDRSHNDRKFLEQVSQTMKFHGRIKTMVQNFRSAGTSQMRPDVKIAEVSNDARIESVTK